MTGSGARSTSSRRAQTERALRDAVRADWARILAPLVRLLRDVQRAEDCAQDACIAALGAWETGGVPDEPRAWLISTARNRAIDLIRREARRDELEGEAARLAVDDNEPAGVDLPPLGEHGPADDDVLRLVFLCCHPALAPETQAALCLRLLCGLSTEEIARAFLVPEPTMAKRLTRAKNKIAKASIPFTIPPADELPARLTGAAATVYLLFNEGYAATGGEVPLRPALVDEALRLGRLLHALLPESPTACGLLALMLLHDSRRAARLDPETGEPVLLADQDRARWDRAAIVEGTMRLGEGLAHSPDQPDAYVVQAAISACHALAASWDDTDWAAITSWYDVLLRIEPTPVVALNRAVALAERDGPAAGLAAVDAITGLTTYPLSHATRAEYLARTGRTADAAAAYAAALALPLAGPVRRQLERRLAELG
ncbi:MAG: sigma-70 family RNA polymerase sigma factor [Solirubrobacteraceae bacterium]|nr:sigma-70 family RNA polymerase sigma factor [Solirubrobacteraceae bacterium]